MMELPETQVESPIVQEGGLEGIQTLAYLRIVVTLALMYPSRDTLLDDHNMSTTVGPVGISERVSTHSREACTCLVLWSTSRNTPTFVGIESFVSARVPQMFASFGVTRMVKEKVRVKDIRQHPVLRKKNRKIRWIRQLEFSKNWQTFWETRRAVGRSMTLRIVQSTVG